MHASESSGSGLPPGSGSLTFVDIGTAQTDNRVMDHLLESSAGLTQVNGRSLASKLNWLRAGVLGANDGIVSTAGLVMGVAGATTNSHTLLIAGLAGMVAGALSMAGGEYVSVSSQRDTEIAALARKQKELDAEPDKQLEVLAGLYRARGISDELSHRVARELSEHDALAAHAETDLGISSSEQTSPWHAAFASFVAFALGAMIPLLLMVLTPPRDVSVLGWNGTARVVATLFGVLLALALTGSTSARLGGGARWRPMLRNVVVGFLAMTITYWIGSLVGS